MDASYLPGLIGYLTRHSEVTQSLTVGVAVAVAVMVAILLRPLLKTTMPRATSAPVLAALGVVVWPLLVIVAISVIERFRLLA